MIPTSILPYAIGGVVAIGAITSGVIWHKGEVAEARRNGAAEQARVDREAFAKAETLATQRQAKAIADQKAKANLISERTDDALQHRYTDLARSYDDLRVRWATYRAGQGRAGHSPATGPAGAAAIPDAAYCPSQGWVSLDVAAAAAEAADTAIAKDDAWREWWTAQEKAWPK
jgi:hypothetical protein